MCQRKVATTAGRRRRSAFTLIEMLVVLLVSGIVMALAAPKLNPARHRGDAAAHLVRSALQLAQRSALMRQHDVIVSFDTSGSRFRIVWDANNNAAVDSLERTVWQSLETGNRFTQPSTGISGTVTASVSGAGVKTLNDFPTITFHRDGTVSTSAEIYLTTAAQKTGVTSRAIRVIQATGRTTWFRQSATGTWSLAKI